MNNKVLRVQFNALFVVILILFVPTLWAAEGFIVTTVESDYASARDALEQAIIGEGLVVNNVAHIGDMLARTGRDLGAGKQIYKQAEVFEFCSASLSRNMMAANPHHIVFCPFTIAIYELAEKPGTTHFAYRIPTGGGRSAPLAAVSELLQQIVEFAAE
jgi:uncharacterized protein (DUF302 family)